MGSYRLILGRRLRVRRRPESVAHLPQRYEERGESAQCGRVFQFPERNPAGCPEPPTQQNHDPPRRVENLLEERSRGLVDFATSEARRHSRRCKGVDHDPGTVPVLALVHLAVAIWTANGRLGQLLGHVQAVFYEPGLEPSSSCFQIVVLGRLLDRLELALVGEPHAHFCTCRGHPPRCLPPSI